MRNRLGGGAIWASAGGGLLVRLRPVVLGATAGIAKASQTITNIDKTALSQDGQPLACGMVERFNGRISEVLHTTHLTVQNH